MSLRVAFPLAALRRPFLLGGLIIAGMLAIAPPKASAAEPIATVQDLARASWPILSPAQKRLVDLLAEAAFEEELSPTQRARIGGTPSARFTSLPEWRKTAFRGMAIKQLGFAAPDALRQAI